MQCGVAAAAWVEGQVGQVVALLGTHAPLADGAWQGIFRVVP